ncbi:hypothetical protein SODALDRAFT_323540 [Sodiomyces alkalinus F11]|uniref:MADS-box domain-containing protein n=1 Tax=Sodiomyces alkalinus (strain CBS 110278 / VKM F-3762 / F11) TaxID=1314773 RepID=A0A3N2PX69_SODAK|nr:hypothetical protein SODALDRAFT_323540 [Sodiomyces alkalinus F11]ROT39068.1 hypothetical protein SODALDRAFT_323540 [Sodiomyces alkalinus F11]
MTTTRETSRATKAFLAKFRRRKHTIYSKLRDIHEDCNAEVYLAIRYRGKFYCFAALDDTNFPPPVSEILGVLRVYSKPTPFSSPGSFFNPPENLAPDTIEWKTLI